MSKPKLNLYLGCNGAAYRDGFILCNSCRNIILDINSIEKDNRDKVIDFLDNAANLFTMPTESNVKAFNIINLLHKKFSIFRQDSIINFQKFFQTHKECGVYLMIITE